MENKCEQLGCICNQNGMCIHYREPVWEEFGTSVCRENTDAMYSEEDEEIENGDLPNLL